MNGTTQTAASAERRATADARDAVSEARSGLADTMDAVRSTAGNVGDRLPDVIETVKASASEGARTVQQWPESTQRLAAAFSLGLGVGLTIAGAPRLLVAASLVPAIAVSATILGRDPKPTGH
jgi:hypothetical protein